MMFQRPVSFSPVGRARPQARRGTFALEPIEALPRLSERVSRLAERALEPNPFFLPEFLAPAIQALGRRGLKLATFTDRDDLRFFAPVVASGGGLTGAKLAIWTHPYAPLGTPLIDSDVSGSVCESLIRHLRTSGRHLLALPELPLAGPVARSLKDAAERRGFWTDAARQNRPILLAGNAADPDGFDRMVNSKRRREMDRQLRNLCEAGAVSFMSARTASEIEAAFATFIALEASGWKGRGGSALQRRRSTHDFARIAVTHLAHRGVATIDVLRVGDRPAAALIRFDHGGLSVPWKIAYDEAFAASSPGKQLMADETRRWLRDRMTSRVDPVCEPDNALMTSLWTDREPYGTLLISTRRWGLGARLKAGIINASAAGRRQAKSLLRRKPQPPRPAAKPPATKPAHAKPKRPRSPH